MNEHEHSDKIGETVEGTTVSPSQIDHLREEVNRLRQRQHDLAGIGQRVIGLESSVNDLEKAIQPLLERTVRLEEKVKALEASIRESRSRTWWGVGILVTIITAAINIILRFV